MSELAVPGARGGGREGEGPCIRVEVFLTTLVRQMRLDPEGTCRIDRGGTVST